VPVEALFRKFTAQISFDPARAESTKASIEIDVGSFDIDNAEANDEPRGKAGGYALQGLASVFVTRVEGSITNIVGLPLEALIEMLPQFGWLLENSPRVTR